MVMSVKDGNMDSFFYLELIKNADNTLELTAVAAGAGLASQYYVLTQFM